MANIKINELENRQQITALSEEELRGISGGKATDLMSEAVSEMKTIIQTWEAETKKIIRPRKKNNPTQRFNSGRSVPRL